MVQAPDPNIKNLTDKYIIYHRNMQISDKYKKILKTTPEIVNNLKIQVFKNLRLSRKRGINVCKYIVGDTFDVALDKMAYAIDHIKPIPFKRHVGGVGHKPNMAAGRYCVKFSKYVASIMQNILKNNNIKSKNARIFEMYVTKGKTIWGIRRRARGSADRIKKKACNIYLKYKII